MKIADSEIQTIDLVEVDNFARTITEDLCGEKYRKRLSEQEEVMLSELISKARGTGLNHAQFDELLLLLDQHRVSKAFFAFFFGNRAHFAELRTGVGKFRGLAMLCFGNFLFAYKRLIERNDEELRHALEPYSRSSDQIVREFKQRPSKAIEIDKIERDLTWYVGYIASKTIETEGKQLARKLSRSRKLPNNEKVQLTKLAEAYQRMVKSRQQVQQRALNNTDIYLTWDYMDVYVATSMRRSWEFEETFDFVNELFLDKRLRELKLRYFDPTQSLCKGRIDKGLVEGLMLKRASCTIYMTQEYDTMGKDSELAATLAQGKTVIAYIPTIDIQSHARKIARYPLDFFNQRLLILRAEGAFDEQVLQRLRSKIPDYARVMEEFLRRFEKYRASQPLTLWLDRENQFKKSLRTNFRKLCEVLAIVEHYNFERRDQLLRSSHPLAIQVNLRTGVANGVLVVRNVKQCADLLYSILTNSMNFELRHLGERRKGVYVLEEQISKCPFRVVTDYEKLTNSFWNFYETPLR